MPDTREHDHVDFYRLNLDRLESPPGATAQQSDDGWWCGWCDEKRSWSTSPGLYYFWDGMFAMLCKRCCKYRWREMPEGAQKALHHA